MHKRLSLTIIAVANLLVTLFFWWQGSGSLFSAGLPGMFIALGRLVGLLSMLLILTQLVLIGRIKYVEHEFGHDKLNILHRYIGTYLLFLLFFHPVFLTVGYALEHEVSVWAQFADFFLNWPRVRNAVLGLSLLVFVILVSVWLRKKLRYETWYFTHLLIYIALVLIIGHQVNFADVSYGAGFYYWYALNFTIFGFVLLYRFIRPLYLATKHEFIIEKIVPENPAVTSVYLTGKQLEAFTFEPGQFANLTFLDKHMWYTHPFSFSQAPNGRTLRFSIKSVGDFTYQIPNLKPGTRVIIDGPLGVFVERMSKRDRYLFIVGGIGITPVRSMIESLSKKGKDQVLIYGNKTLGEAVFKQELAEFSVNVHHVLSEEELPGHEHGYITGELIKKLAPDYIEREVYLCGPPVMMQKVISELMAIGVPIGQIHFERFALE